jgi:Na+/H+ antiporter NhaD/arsenite permease-like protein
MLTAFMLQGVIKIETATIAMTAGLFLLIVSDRHKVEQTLAHDIDWATIFFFMGLFMIVESLVETGFINHIATGVMSLTHGEPKTTSMAILWLSGIFSAVIDNVPFVAAMIPVLERLGVLINNPDAMHPIWWSMALGACLGGNGTMIGASANIVAIGIANRNGFHISFKEYTKIGALFALNAIIVSTFYVLIRYY